MQTFCSRKCLAQPLRRRKGPIVELPPLRKLRVVSWLEQLGRRISYRMAFSCHSARAMTARMHGSIGRGLQSHSDLGTERVPKMLSRRPTAEVLMRSQAMLLLLMFIAGC